MSMAFDSQQVHRAGFGTVSFGTDDKLIVWFYDKPLIHGAKSKEANRPIFENVTHVHIQQPGERDCFEQPADREHQARFPKAWAAYESKQKNVIDGTPLTVLFPNDLGLVKTFEHINIFTIEQLAGLNDTGIQNIGTGGRGFFEKAKEFIAVHEKGKGFNELSNRLDAMQLRETEKDTKIAALEAALAEAQEKRGPGRPRTQAA